MCQIIIHLTMRQVVQQKIKTLFKVFFILYEDIEDIDDIEDIEY